MLMSPGRGGHRERRTAKGGYAASPRTRELESSQGQHFKSSIMEAGIGKESRYTGSIHTLNHALEAREKRSAAKKEHCTIMHRQWLEISAPRSDIYNQDKLETLASRMQFLLYKIPVF